MTTLPDRTPEQQQPISLRAMYAQIALADLPTPRGVRFGGELRQMDLTLDTTTVTALEQVAVEVTA